uniref:Reelin domain-containing protein n=1 Tax=Nothobranchius furzeri TaxID=105023 RepID=A0A8C6KIJ1_NOTFU
MSPSLLLVSGVVFFSSVALPTLSFSHGASHASCLEMIPGHIRAHPLDPHHSFVIFHASASSYLPGQLITVTVRSSRDFMGFLLQARGAGTHTLHCLSEDFTLSLKIIETISSFIHPSDPASSHPSEYSVLVSTHPSSRPTTPIHSSSSFQTKHLRATMAISALPSPLPISTPSHLPSAPSPSTPTSSTTQPSSFNPPTDSLFSTAAVSTNPNSSHCFLFSNISSPSTVTKVSSSTSKPTSFASPPPSLPPTSTSTPLSVGGSSSSSYVSSITTPHPGPLSSIHLLPQTPVTSSVPSKKTTEGQRVGIPLTSSNPVTNLGSPTQTTVIHLNPKPFPNHKLNRGQKTKPELPNIDTKPKKPSGPSEGPDKKGKYPDINPRHSTWELAMLLGCSAGLGMVLVVGVRYMYRQACGRWTEVTLNDREREYDRGGRGLIQVQECGDLVRVRKIRENSFVLLTEYDVLAPPGE